MDNLRKNGSYNQHIVNHIWKIQNKFHYNKMLEICKKLTLKKILVISKILLCQNLLITFNLKIYLNNPHLHSLLQFEIFFLGKL